MRKSIVILLTCVSLILNVNAQDLIAKYKDGSYKLVNDQYCALSNDSDIEYVQPNFQYSICSFGNDWVFEKMNYKPSSLKKEPLPVAVIDTGINPNLEYFEDRLEKPYNAINFSDDAADDNGHGTHIAGIIASMDNTIILPIKALDEDGHGETISIANAIRYAVEHKVKIINLSLGGRNYDRLLDEIIEYATDSGCIVIASAGNTYGEAQIYPACFANVLSVGAINEDGNICPWSNRGDSVDVYAGGEKILSILPSGEFVEKSGTSQACAFVSGGMCSLEDIEIGKLKERKIFSLGVEEC